MSGASLDKADRKTRPSEVTPRDGRQGSDTAASPLQGAKGGEEPTGLAVDPLPQDGEYAALITLGRYFRSAGPWGVSVLLHSLMLIVMAFCMASPLTSGLEGSVSLTANPDDGLYDELFDSPFLQDDLELRDTDDLTTEFMSEPKTNADLVYRELDVDLTEDVGLDALPTEDLMDILRWENSSNMVDDLQPAREVAASRIHEADTVQQAVGGLFGNIKKKLAKDDLMVVWIFDASISLVDDRQRVARELEKFFDEIKAQKSEDSHEFMHVAVAFGRNVEQLVAPTPPNQKIIDAVRNVPPDDSGVENVFSAVEWAVNRYGRRWEGEMMIAIWADESGDDLARLERAVVVCQRRKVSVSVVGPSAILGREIGTHAWTHKPSGKVFLLPVSRGPDSAYPERLRLPYWFETGMPKWESAGYSREAGVVPPGHEFPPWYGGEQLEGMVSGFGPFGLVRLAIETGGSYTIFDRPADRGPFRMDVMRPYLPDYRVADDVFEDIKHHPLRAAVVGTAALTLQTLDLQPPQTIFFEPPPRYYQPARFRDMLKDSLPKQQLLARRTIVVTERALAKFGPDGMEELYKAEQSRRWKAWYDLTRGRLLAAQARCMEYDTACGLLAQLLRPNTNYVDFGPSSELRYGPIAQLLAEESQRLLRRCVEDNPSTPWALLAQRELDYPLGIAFQQRAIPAPPPRPPSPPRPPAPPPKPEVPIIPPKL